MTPATRSELIYAIATRRLNARKLAELYECTVDELRLFVEANKPAIEAEHRRLTEPPQEDPAAVSPSQLDELWISNKFERLKRLQKVADDSYDQLFGAGMTPAEYATAMREFRSYLMLAANELGQLLHRGSGDAGTGDSLSVSIEGVDMDALR